MRTEIPYKSWVLPIQIVRGGLLVGLYYLAFVSPSGFATVAFVVVLALMYLPYPMFGLPNVFVSPDYIQSGQKKVLIKEITDAKWLLGCLWIYDRYDDSICIRAFLHSEPAFKQLQTVVKEALTRNRPDEPVEESADSDWDSNEWQKGHPDPAE